MSRIKELLDTIEQNDLDNLSDDWRKLRSLVDDKPDELYTVEDGWAGLFSGTAFSYKHPTVDMISIVDITASLGKLCRYGGHVHTFYSVAEHSCLMMRHARDHYDIPFERKLLRTILLHDASEGITGMDANRPIKQMLPALKHMETQVLEPLIAEKYDLIYPHPPLIRELDSRIIKDERAQAMNPSDNDWGVDKLEALDIELQFWTWEEAIDNFFMDYVSVAP